MHVEIFIPEEGRRKKNEVVIARSDIASTVLYYPAFRPDDTIIVLVREVRAPASNATGYVLEVVGGSSLTEDDPDTQAASEVEEEVGLVVDSGRLRKHITRQMAPTALAHRAHPRSYRLNRKELASLIANQNAPRGVADDTEVTYTVITTFGEIRRHGEVAFADFGMVAAVLLDVYASMSLVKRLGLLLRSWFRRPLAK